MIVEALCIGCVKCISACPVDAIVGTSKQMHTILPDACIGCGLCVALVRWIALCFKRPIPPPKRGHTVTTHGNETAPSPSRPTTSRNAVSTKTSVSHANRRCTGAATCQTKLICCKSCNENVFYLLSLHDVASCAKSFPDF